MGYGESKKNCYSKHNKTRLNQEVISIYGMHSTFNFNYNHFALHAFKHH